MKRFSILMLVTTFVFFPLFAQESHGGSKAGKHCPEMPKGKPDAELIAQRQTERLAHELELTEAQYDSIYQIHLTYAKKKIQKMEEREQNRVQMDSMSICIRHHLTEQQAVKYDEMRNRNLKFGPRDKEMLRERPDKDRPIERPQKEKLHERPQKDAITE